MGKRYICDYCNKTMVSSPAIVKTHNKGMVHKKLVSDHYQQFKDPETILSEESMKKPCSRFAKDECNFGSICHYSHYSREEIALLQEYVINKNKLKVDIAQPSFEDLYQKLQAEKSKESLNSDEQNTTIYDENGVTHILPWIYNPILDSYSENLPPSIKKLELKDFTNVDITEWG